VYTSTGGKKVYYSQHGASWYLYKDRKETEFHTDRGGWKCDIEHITKAVHKYTKDGVSEYTIYTPAEFRTLLFPYLL
jgi:hypothetical protein